VVVRKDDLSVVAMAVLTAALMDGKMVDQTVQMKAAESDNVSVE
jgi:hypothetical protein